MMRRVLPLLLTLALTAVLATLTARLTLRRYDELRSGWSWDLAYYNQWCWSLTHGDGILSVRPIGPWGVEGPRALAMNYLSPGRFLILPVYRLWPGPRTLLIIAAAVFWCVIPAMYGLVRNESGSAGLGLSAAALTALTPLLWPLALNDFRELQLAAPFVVWAVDGVRGRERGKTILGIGGMLACRQEFGLVVALLAFLPPRRPEDLGQRYRWARALWLLGLSWLLIGFLGYLRWMRGAWVPAAFLHEFFGPKPLPGETFRTAAEIMLLGLGAWVVLWAVAPRAGVLVLPLAWAAAGGKLAWDWLGTESWHHVRYAAPAAALGLAAGGIGYARLGTWLAARKYGVLGIALAWAVSAAGMIGLDFALVNQLAQVPRPISEKEAEALRGWIGRVAPGEGVLGHYDVSAPLSSRRLLFSNVLDVNRPPRYPTLQPEIAWVFLRRGDEPADIWLAQGFRLVEDGPHIQVFRRETIPTSPSLQGPASSLLARTPWDWNDVVVLAADFLGGLPLAVILLAPGPALLVWAGKKIGGARKLAPIESGASGQDAAMAILARSDRADGVTLDIVDGPMTDLFDPWRRSIRLAPATAESRTPLALAVAAREATYAVRNTGWSQARLMLHFALRLGVAAGIIVIFTGVIIGSWRFVQMGAFLTSAAIIAPISLLRPLERATGQQAQRLLAEAAIVGEAEQNTIAVALDALTWWPFPNHDISRFFTLKRISG